MLTGTNYRAWKKSMRILGLIMEILQMIELPKPFDATSVWTKADGWTFSEIHFR